MINFPIKYQNGNYQVTIEADGTKTRITPEEEFKAKRPETIDVNLSNYCENNCSFCYISASKSGKTADIKKDEFFKTIKPYTELAVNFYNKRRQFYEDLMFLAERNLIVNVTVHYDDFAKYKHYFLFLQKQKLIYGLGVSIQKDFDLKKLNGFKELVVHTIAGVTKKEVFEKLKNKKVLVLGFKTKGKTEAKAIPELTQQKEIIKLAIEKKHFEVLTFDNLAIEQLSIKDMVLTKVWEEHYMGAEGSASFYYDAVSKKAYCSSLEKKEKGIEAEKKSSIELFEVFKRGVL